MDGTRFNELVRTLLVGGTRRRLLRRLAALSLAGAGATLLDAQESAAGRRKKRRQARHHPGKKKDNRKGKRKDQSKPPQTCDVCASGCAYSSVQGAIDAASSGAVIRICAGAYTNDGAAQVALIAGKSLTLVGAGDGDDEASNTLFIATGGERVVHIDFATVTLQGLRITGSQSASDGGNGILISPDSTVTMSHCTVTKNTNTGDPDGGSVFSGGIANNGALTMTNCTVSENATRTAAGGIGNFLGTLTMTNCTVRGNTAGEGPAGILNSAATLTLINSQVIENTSGSAPAGILNDSFGGPVNLNDSSSVSDNTPGNCGGSGFNGAGCAP